jgi:hypothetical protein
MVVLTARDTEILECLTHRVRVFTLNQIARTWWSESSRSLENAKARIQLLERTGLVQMQRAPAHPEILLETPVIIWRSGMPTPDFGAASYQLQVRWARHLVSTIYISATQKAANKFDGHGGRFPRAVERTHDIHLARVFLLYRRLGSISGWIFEDRLREQKRGKAGRLPDVIFQDGSGTKVIEFGGAYSKEKLASFHAHCREQSLPYEVW